jgi:hypothetical protein
MGDRRIGGLVLAAAAAANAVVVVLLWLRAGGITEPGGAADRLVSLGRVTGLVGAYLSLVMILLSAAPDGRRMRITVKDRGDSTARIGSLRPGPRVVVEGPYGGFTAANRRLGRVAMIAGGVGITPVRALLEEMPGDVTVVYRAALRGGPGASAAVARAPARPGARHRRARRLPVRPARDDRCDPHEFAAGRCGAPPDPHRALRALMRRALVALLLTVVAVVALASYRTHPPRRPPPQPPAAHARPRATPTPPGSRTARGPAISTPFSVILRREALRAGSAKIDVVSGATYTSESWIESLRSAIRAARG